jgi:hypothetical protein
MIKTVLVCCEKCEKDDVCVSIHGVKNYIEIDIEDRT